MSVRRKTLREKLGLDPSVESFECFPRRGRCYAWSIDPTTFEAVFFDPDVDGTYAPSAPLMNGWPRSPQDARRRALDELKFKRRDLNRAIKKLERDIAANDPPQQEAPAIPADNRGESV